MQPTPNARHITQKGLLKFVCKVAGLIFILQSLISVQRIISVGTAINTWSEGNLALGIDLISNAAISWILLTKSDWIAEKLDINADEVRTTVTKQDLVEIVVIVVAILLVINSATGIFDKLASYIYMTFDTGENQGTPDIFSGLLTLAGGLLILKHHKRVINWISNLRETEHSE